MVANDGVPFIHLCLMMIETTTYMLNGGSTLYTNCCCCCCCWRGPSKYPTIQTNICHRLICRQYHQCCNNHKLNWSCTYYENVYIWRREGADDDDDDDDDDDQAQSKAEDHNTNQNVVVSLAFMIRFAFDLYKQNDPQYEPKGIIIISDQLVCVFVRSHSS